MKQLKNQNRTIRLLPVTDNGTRIYMHCSRCKKITLFKHNEDNFNMTVFLNGVKQEQEVGSECTKCHTTFYGDK